MENAGHAAYYALCKELNIFEKSFLVCCGTGNNGGDGCVLARKIHADGGWVKVFIIGDPGRFKGAARLNYEIITRLPIEVKHILSIDDLQEDLFRSDFVVDAIFGTGLSRDVEGLFREVIEEINKSGKPIMSIDIPSGVQGDTGKVMGVAIKADFTITFGLPKYGNILFPGCDLGGKLYVSHISFPPEIYTAEHLKVEINLPFTFPLHGIEKRDAEFGKVFYFLGTSDFGVLTFLNLGKGDVNLAFGSSLGQGIGKYENRISMLPQKETKTGTLSFQDIQELLKHSFLSDIVILGPGLFLDEGVRKLVPELISEIEKPIIIFGDNISTLNDPRDIFDIETRSRVFLVDINGLSYIAGKSAEYVEINKINVLRQTTKKIKATIVLLDSRALIGFPDLKVVINPSGSPQMKTDKLWKGLDGTIAAMYSLGLSLDDAIKQGIFIQGLAGDLMADKGLQDEWTSQDFLNNLSDAVKIVQSGLDTDLKNRYEGANLV